MIKLSSSSRARSKIFNMILKLRYAELPVSACVLCMQLGFIEF